MKLEKFRITNYRSIKDSGWINVGQRTVMVGRNESGKSNLLHALRTLKPTEKLDPLSMTHDFPADLSAEAFSNDLDVVHTVWALSDEDRDELAKVSSSRCSPPSTVRPGRHSHRTSEARRSHLQTP